MPRYRRNTPPDSYQHIISRIVNREFRIVSENIRNEYLHRAQLSFAGNDWIPLGFALMSNHIHWAFQAGNRSSDQLIRPIHSGWAQWLNRRQKRMGHVFAQRHRNVGFEAEDLCRLIAYIHNNPVRAGIVSDPADSTWTSHRFFIGECKAPKWLQVDYALHLCGFSTTSQGRLAFHETVRALSAQPRIPKFSGETVEMDRACIRREVGGPIELSDSQYRSDGLSHSVRHVMYARRGTPIRPHFEVMPQQIVAAVCAYLNVPHTVVRSRTHQVNIVEAKRLCLSLWTEFFGRTQIEMACYLGISRSAASKLLRFCPNRYRQLQSKAQAIHDMVLAAHRSA